MMRSADTRPEAETIVGGDRERPRGLTTAEAERRLAQYGPNRYAPERRKTTIVEVLRSLADPMALMLVAASALSFAAGARRDAIVLLVAIAPVLGVDVFLEARSRQALRKLATAVAPRARLLRDGAVAAIPTERVVPGDVALVREGDVFHADGEIAWSANLTADESMLTGESEPVDKPAGARFFAGSRVLTGQGGGVVRETGLSTEYGRIARLVAEAPGERTPI